MTPEHADRLGRLADSLDAVLYAVRLPLSPNTHIEQLVREIRSARDEITKIVVAETGNDPWETNRLTG